MIKWKMELRPMEEYPYNSPWIIAADFDVSMDFLQEDIERMLADYESDHRTGMNVYALYGREKIYVRKERDMNYCFYGWEDAVVKPIHDKYQNIKSPRDLYDKLSAIWCADTCTPRMRHLWTEENRTKGQCSITAFLVQDIFGGKVYGIPLEDGSVHCYNVVGDCCFDLTSEQFGDRAKELVYENNPEQFREDHFAKEEKRLRYERLKEALERL